MHIGGSDNTGDGLASQPCRYRVPGQPLLNRHQVGGVSRSPDGLFVQQEWVPTRGRPAVRGTGTNGASQPTPHTNTTPTHLGAPKSPPTPPTDPQPNPVPPCTAILHNRNNGCRGDPVAPQGGRLGYWTPRGPLGP